MPSKPELLPHELAALHAKKTRQQVLRDYLGQQVELQTQVKAQKKAQADAFARSQQESYDAWKAAEAEEKHEKAARRARYCEELATQVQSDKHRKHQARELEKRGLPGTTTTFSTGPGGAAVNTIRSATGELLPYVLQENVVLSTLGSTIRFNVVSAKDGTLIQTRKKKSSQHFIE